MSIVYGLFRKVTIFSRRDSSLFNRSPPTVLDPGKTIFIFDSVVCGHCAHIRSVYLKKSIQYICMPHAGIPKIWVFSSTSGKHSLFLCMFIFYFYFQSKRNRVVSKHGKLNTFRRAEEMRADARFVPLTRNYVCSPTEHCLERKPICRLHRKTPKWVQFNSCWSWFADIG